MTTQPSSPIKLYRHPLSGHSHRAQLFLSLLALPTEIVDVDLLQGAHKKPAFLAYNPFGQVPVIDDGGVVIADSAAILIYLARKYGGGSWLPVDAVGAAAVQRWLSVAAGEIASGPAAARLITVFGSKLGADEVIGRAHRLLAVMDSELGNRPFLVGSEPTLADIAGYSYVAHAPEGNVGLTDYPNVRAWLARIESLKGFVPMQATKVGLAAA